jgi:hypothetical protein
MNERKSHIADWGEESEKVVLGSIVGSGSLIEEVALRLTPGDFRSTKHRALFALMCSMHARGVPIDIVTLREEMLSSRAPEGCPDALYLAYLSEMALPPLVISHHVGVVKECARRRRMKEKAQALSHALDVGADGGEVEGIAREIMGLCGEVGGFDIASRSLTRELLEGEEQEMLWRCLFPKRALILLTGRYGSGKSLFTLAALRELLARGEKAVVVDADMPRSEIAKRLRAAGLMEALGTSLYYLDLGTCDLRIDGGSPSWRAFKGALRGCGHRVLVFDNLKALVPLGTEMNSDRDMRPVMDELKELRGYGHTLVVLHHVSKSDSAEPFKNSGTIADDIDVGLLIKKGDGGRFHLRLWKERITGVRPLFSCTIDDALRLREAPTESEERRDGVVACIRGAIAHLSEELGERHPTQRELLDYLEGATGGERIMGRRMARQALADHEGRYWRRRLTGVKSEVYYTLL